MKQLTVRDIQRKFRRLVGINDPAKFAMVGGRIDDLSSALPSYEVKYGRAAIAILKLGSLIQDKQDEWLSLAKDIDAVLYARGYRSKGSIMTMQEHRLIGSSHDGARDDGTPRTRYTPLGILAGELSLEDVLRARELSAVIDKYLIDAYFVTGNLRPTAGMLALEMLDGRGMTVRDPRPLDAEKFKNAFPGRKPENAFDIAELHLKKARDFPFARGVRLLDDDAPPKIVRDL